MSLWRQVHPLCVLITLATLTSSGNVPDVEGMEAIGVSNFQEIFLEEILPAADITPTVNQLELRLYTPQLNLLAYLKSEAIVAQAYSPLGPTNSALLTDDTATAIAKNQRLQTSDVLPGDLRRRGPPQVGDPARIASNHIGTVATVKKRTEEDLQTLDGVAVGGKQKGLSMSECGIDVWFMNWP
ncbi:hypothetical protein FIBSPDRAFT_948782 [Athelia psychrophila]|uniref:Uncharacterized protein n=1 Tax=Athelia psychrophila TaxID=1759441 RepID=A0A166QGQ1_9AGAM|nr:hypothetical protein FIBSPDRAFT_948782 [Fibularhizoctonia sp. CBS 109695]